MGYSSNILSETLDRLWKGEIAMQKSETIEQYIIKIVDRFTGDEQLKMRLNNQLTIIANPLLDLITSFEKNEPIMEIKLHELRERFPVCHRLDLIEDIVQILGISNIKVSDFSLFLFGDKNYLLEQFLSPFPLNEPKIKRRPERTTLDWLKYQILSADFSVLSDYVPEIEDYIGESIREALSFVLDSWIKKNPYDVSFFLPNLLGFRLIFGYEVDQMTYDLLYCIWYTYAVQSGDLRISFDRIKEIIKARSGFLQLLHKEDKARVISQPTLESTINHLNKVILREKDDSKRTLYQNTILAIEAYIEIINEKRTLQSARTGMRPTEGHLRRLFSTDQYIRSYLLMNLLPKNLGFDSLFFDDLDQSLFDKNSGTGMYQIHHKDKTRWWSIYLRDLTVINIRYHKLYDSVHITTEDINLLEEGIKMLKELGISRYESGNTNWQITETDIKKVFSMLGGGREYTLSDGRTVLEWWTDGSSVGSQVKADKSFQARLNRFNERIKLLVDKNLDYEAWLAYYYPNNALGDDGWISLGKQQMSDYLWMANTLKHVHLYIHLEDVDFIRETWVEWL